MPAGVRGTRRRKLRSAVASSRGGPAADRTVVSLTPCSPLGPSARPERLARTRNIAPAILGITTRPSLRQVAARGAPPIQGRPDTIAQTVLRTNGRAGRPVCENQRMNGAEPDPGRAEPDPGRAAATTDLGHEVHQIDTLMAGYDGITAGYLIRSDRPCLVETGTAPSAPVVAAALARLGIGPADLATVVVTHIHLDHAGGVGDIAAMYPGAEIVVH